jgi:ribosomal protein S18 acetylase RimI-like enzyme
MEIRDADAADLPFLWEMLACAAHWREASPPLELPRRAAKYPDGWGRKGDCALVAVERDARIGAAWYRLFPGEAPGYGFVAADVRELTLAVAPEFRRRGLGRLLLAALQERARSDGFAALSLSVEPENPARALYERAGFEPVADMGGAVTMLRTLN